MYPIKLPSGMTPGTRLCGRYELDRLLSHGASSVVWKAQDTELDAPVAIKVLLLTDDQSTRMFEKEARTLAALRGADHVLQVYDYSCEELDEARKWPFIVSQLLVGEPLDVRLARRPRPSIAEIARLTDDMARGLEELGRAGFVHRDLKPANILLTNRPGGPRAVLLDLGLATAYGSSTGAGRKGKWRFLGTPRYASPEQTRSPDDATPLFDLWALSVIQYESLTARAPFDGQSPDEVMTVIEGRGVTPPSSVAPSLGEHFDEYFALALSRDAKFRFTTPRALSAAFAEAAARHESAARWRASTAQGRRCTTSAESVPSTLAEISESRVVLNFNPAGCHHTSPAQGYGEDDAMTPVPSSASPAEEAGRSSTRRRAMRRLSTMVAVLCATVLVGVGVLASRFLASRRAEIPPGAVVSLRVAADPGEPSCEPGSSLEDTRDGGSTSGAPSAPTEVRPSTTASPAPSGGPRRVQWGNIIYDGDPEDGLYENR